MAKDSNIEWTEATWNPWYGCHKVSQGCKNCYMFRDTPRFGKDPNTVVRSKTTFNDPLKWHEPKRIFTCSWSDFFIEEADEWRDEAFAIMALTPHHTYQVLTKRPERMLEYLTAPERWPGILRLASTLGKLSGRIVADFALKGATSLKNVWLGVSVEDQKTADERIPLLYQTPAFRRWLSIEPLLAPVDLSDYTEFVVKVPNCLDSGAPLDWVVVGGESGPDARPMHPDWARSIRDQCQSAGVPFFFKQWGEWQDLDHGTPTKRLYLDDQEYESEMARCDAFLSLSGHFVTKMEGTDGVTPYRGMVKLGKKKAGRTLDGRTWDEMPEVSNGR